MPTTTPAREGNAHTAPYHPAPDYLVRAALAWVRNNGRFERLTDAERHLMLDLRPDPTAPAVLWHATKDTLVKAWLSGRVLFLSFRYADLLVTREYALPREFADQQVTA